MAQPSLNELMTRFLAARAASGGSATDAGDVEPHEVPGGFRATPATTWAEATAVFRLFGLEPEPLVLPPEWAAFAALESPTAAVPLAAGFFPQRVRKVPAGNLSARPADAPVEGFTTLRNWVRKALVSKSPTTLLVASGVAAGLGDWADADAALKAAEPLCVGEWRAVWENQKASLEWLRGTDQSPLTGDAPPTRFNRGLRALVSGRPTEAASELTAAKGLPAASGWVHLANLYLALAHARVW